MDRHGREFGHRRGGWIKMKPKKRRNPMTDVYVKNGGNPTEFSVEKKTCKKKKRGKPENSGFMGNSPHREDGHRVLLWKKKKEEKISKKVTREGKKKNSGPNGGCEIDGETAGDGFPLSM